MSSLPATALQALSLMDLTSLNENDTDAIIEDLCQQASTPAGAPAAVCVYPQFIKTARARLDSLGLKQVKIATVTNFPHGNSDIEQAVLETAQAVALGADEVDVVFPYKSLRQGNSELGFDLVQRCKAACTGRVKLKVIIETGELKTAELIEQASNIAISAGTDFIKTSTGKVAINATPEAAKIMLTAIKASGKNIGFKAAGGVKTAEDAEVYLSMAQKIMGDDWLNAEHFRFGASSLLGNLLNTLGHANQTKADSSY